VTPAVPRDDDAALRDDVMTVLVVEDNAEIRDYLRGHLTPHYRVIEAGGGAEGIELARAAVPDLIICDLMMPDTDGLALCAALRADPDTDFVPIILLTARAGSSDVVTGLGAGADDYVVKPFDVAELLARADALIASRRRLRDRFGAQAPDAGPATNAAVTADATGRFSFAGQAMEAGASVADAAYLARVRLAVEAGLADEGFGVAQLARAVHQDRSHLYRRVRELTGETPTELIRRLRLERAAALLAEQAGSVAEVAYATGFTSVSYFCKTFRAAYGATPAVWRDRQLQPAGGSGAAHQP
jgi:DNA-binding response OmpR family regulator